MQMNGSEIWIRDGSISSRPKKPNGLAYQDKFLFDQFGMVRITTGDESTEIQWNMGCPNWASLMLVAKLLPTCVAPFTLKYFNSGWFIEEQPDATLACDRIESLIFKSDVRLSDKAYTSVTIPDFKIVSPGLREAFHSGTAPDNKSVICVVEPERETCQVEFIGQDSPIARVWGNSPNSYPCLTGHSYDRAVTPEYFNVVETGKPHYDHVLASMMRPDGELHWIGYHRVILPDVQQGRKRVRVVSEFAPVKIQLL
jgi:hypothetical protein